MADKQKVVDWPPCQLMLVVEPGPGALQRLKAALECATISAVLIRPMAGDKLGAGEVKPLVDLIQDQGAAALLFGDAVLTKTLGADGVHLPAGLDTAQRVAAARALLGPEANLGVDAGHSRHTAMEAGEGGADYVAFSAAEATEESRRARDDLVTWWAEIFEIPCVAMDIHSADDAEQADTCGADFAALTLPRQTVEEIMVLAGDVNNRLQAYEMEGGT